MSFFSIQLTTQAACPEIVLNQLMTQAASEHIDSNQLMTLATFPGNDSDSTHDSSGYQNIYSNQLTTQAKGMRFSVDS